MAEDTRKLFVAGLPDSISEEVLRTLFEAAGGTVVEVSLPKDRATGRPRGFGFVTLATSEEANSARASLDGSFQGGKSISVRPFQNEPPRREAGGPSAGPRPAGSSGGGGFAGPAAAPDRTLYVGNLPYDATVEEVEALIDAASPGGVARVHLPMDPEGRKRGFGFVTMASADVAKTAIDNLRGADVRGRRIVVNLAHPKGDRPPPREGGYSGGGGGFSGGGGGGGGGFSGGGGGGGFAPPPPQQRKTFDDRRRRGAGPSDDGPPGGGGGGGGRRGGGGGKNWDKGRNDDWDGDD